MVLLWSSGLEFEEILENVSHVLTIPTDRILAPILLVNLDPSLAGTRSGAQLDQPPAWALGVPDTGICRLRISCRGTKSNNWDILVCVSVVVCFCSF